MKKIMLFIFAVAIMFGLTNLRQIANVSSENPFNDFHYMEFEEKDIALNTGDSYKLNLQTLNVESEALVSIKSSDPSVVKTTGTLLTALKPGTCQITAKYNNAVTTTNIRVGGTSESTPSNKKITGLAINDYNLTWNQNQNVDNYNISIECHLDNINATLRFKDQVTSTSYKLYDSFNQADLFFSDDYDFSIYVYADGEDKTNCEKLVYTKTPSDSPVIDPSLPKSVSNVKFTDSILSWESSIDTKYYIEYQYVENSITKKAKVTTDNKSYDIANIIKKLDDIFYETYNVTFYVYPSYSSVQNATPVIYTREIKAPDIGERTVTHLSWYGDSVLTLTGSKLKTYLNEKMASTKVLQTYGSARQNLSKTDADPNKSGNIILFYSSESINGTWDAGKTWNREHVWPKSKSGGLYTTYDNNKATPGDDLHHLRPAAASGNSSRGNKAFGATDTSSTMYPGDRWIGDVARILFYMNLTYDMDWVKLDVCKDTSLLLKWNRVDPVDSFEANRNEVVKSIQGNYNPFIDMNWLADELYK